MKVTRILHSQPTRLLSIAGLAAVLSAGAAITQEGGGILLTFGIDQRLSWDSNPGLDVPSSGSVVRSSTQLSFSGALETARDELSFKLGGLLRGEADAGGSDFSFALERPSAEVAYVRTGFSSSFSASAFLRETDLAEGLVLIEGPEEELPVLVFESGTASTKGVRLAYKWGEGELFGGAVRAGLTTTGYSGTTNPDLVDNRNVTVGAGLRFTLNEVTEATIDIDHRRYDEDGPALAEDSTTVSAALTRALPRGSLRGKISTTSDGDGSRTGLSFGHSYELPRGSLSVDLGLTEAGSSGTDVTGALAWRQELPRGTFSARLSQEVTNDSSNEETLVTALSLGLSQELSPLMGLNMGATWARAEDTSSGTVTENASLSASVSYALTEDWAMNVGASYRVKDQDGTGRANASSVFLSIGRTFQWRP